MKGNTQGFNRGLDCDVIVAEVNAHRDFWDLARVELLNTFRCSAPGTIHQSQTRRDLWHDREALTRNQEDRTVWTTTQCPAQLVPSSYFLLSNNLLAKERQQVIILLIAAVVIKLCYFYLLSIVG